MVRSATASRISTSREPRPTTSPPAHWRIRSLPSSPVDPSIKTLICDFPARLREGLGLAQRTPALVLRRNDGLPFVTPLDVQVRIIPCNRTFKFRRIVSRRLIENMRRIRNDAEPVREPRWY